MKTYPEIIQQLIETNDKLIAGTIKLDIAKQICQNTQVLINAAKLQLEVCKFKGTKESEFLSEPENKKIIVPSKELTSLHIEPKHGKKIPIDNNLDEDILDPFNLKDDKKRY
jgi:hypothetical protein